MSSHKKKVFQILPYTDLEYGGGAPRSALTVAKLLIDRGIDVELMVPAKALSNDLGCRIKELGIPVLTTPRLPWCLHDQYDRKLSFREQLSLMKRKCSMQLAEIEVKRSMLSSSPDLVYFSNLATTCGVNSARGLRIPYVLHARELVGTQGKFRVVTSRSNFSKALENASRVVCISSDTNSFYREEYSLRNTTVIPNAVFGRGKPPKNNELFRNEAVRLCIMGTVRPDKGQMDAVRAARLVKNRGMKIQLEIWGPYRDELYFTEIKRYITSHDMMHYVKYKGITNSPEAVFSNSDIVLMCSERECFGRVTVEALGAGCVVIGTNSGGTTEILHNDTSLLYEYGDYRELANKIQHVVNNSEKYRSEQCNRISEALNRYSTDRLGDQMYELIESVLSRDSVVPDHATQVIT